MEKDKKKLPFQPPVVEIIYFDDWEPFLRFASEENVVECSQIDDATVPPTMLSTSDDDSAEKP